MADVAIATVDASQARGQRCVVAVSSTVRYRFYIAADEDFEYVKSTDGGATWGTPVQISLDDSLNSFDVYYDRWVPGDTTGTLIHVAWTQMSTDGVRYRSLDTNGDTLGTLRTVTALTSAIDNSLEVWISLTKTISGDLYITYCADGGDERGFFRSEDAGATWGSDLNAVGMVEDGGSTSPDWGLAFPASGTGDGDDMWLLYQDGSANALTLKLYDASAGTMAESATILTFAENATNLTGQPGWNAGIRLSDGHLILAAVTERDTATADHRVFDITSTASFAELTAITTDIDDHYFPAVYVDEGNNIYVAFNGLRDGSEDLGTATKVYYVKSTDGGSTWSAGSTAYMEGSAALVMQVWAPPCGPVFDVAWRQGATGTEFVGNAVNAVVYSAGGGGGSSIVVIRRRRAA